MIRKIRKSISSLTVRAFRNSSSGTTNQGWFFEKREGSLTQFNPSISDSFDVAAFYVEGQLDFHNQLPENVRQLFHQLHDMEEKVKALENEISVYVMQFQETSPPRALRQNPTRRKTNAVGQCCIPGLWNRPKPTPIVNETRRRLAPRQLGQKCVNKRRSVNTGVQTPEDMNCRGSRLSRVSWDSKVDVRYINSKQVQSDDSHRAPLQDANFQGKPPEDIKNVVHLKIKIPKDVLNLTNDNGQSVKRLENEWNLFNLIEASEKQSSPKDERMEEKPDESERPEKDQQFSSSNHSCCQTPCLKNSTQPQGNLPNDDRSKNEQRTENGKGNTIVGSSVVHSTGRGSVHTETIGIPVKEPGKSKCESKGCNCKGSNKNDHNLEKLGEGFDMTESELTVLEKAVHKKSGEPTELKIRTEYGSVNVVSHDPDCSCKVCETFGSHKESHPKHVGRSESAAIVTKKVIRVYYNGDYRNIYTHTEECGCEICRSIEEHSYRLNRLRPSMVSTNTTNLVIKDRGVCGCQNCKTVEMEAHDVEVDTALSSSSCQMDVCYYSNATIPSMQSFPRDLTSTDEQLTAFTSPPSITSSDCSNETFEPPMNRNTQVKRPRAIENSVDSDDSCDTKPSRDVGKYGKLKQCEDSYLGKPSRQPRRQNRQYLPKPSSKSSPAEYENILDESHACSCLQSKAKSSPNKCTPAPTKSILSAPKTQNPLTPIEAPPIIEQEIQPNKNEPKSKDHNKQVSGYNSGYTTLEALIHDLIQGQPGEQKDKVYTVTLGEASNKAYTTVHIVDRSRSNDSENTRNTIAKSEVEKMPEADKANSNVFFIKHLPSSVADKSSSVSDMEGAGNDVGIVTGPAYTNRSNNGNGDAHRPDLKKAYKLTVRFGKKVVSFFRQKEKKKSASDDSLIEKGNSLDAKSSKMGAYKETRESPQLQSPTTPQLLQIQVNPKYFSLDPIRGGGEASGRLPDQQLLYFLGENHNLRNVTAVSS